MPCIYHLYTWHILIYTVHITFTSCFQGFVALIAHTRRPIRTPLTTCQTYTMRLILHQRVLVSSRFYKYTFQFWCICCRYTVYIQCILLKQKYSMLSLFEVLAVVMNQILWCYSEFNQSSQQQHQYETLFYLNQLSKLQVSASASHTTVRKASELSKP